MHFVAMQVPLWVWIAWIPQLLVSLQRPESLHCKRILTLLALSYPQARPLKSRFVVPWLDRLMRSRGHADSRGGSEQHLTFAYKMLCGPKRVVVSTRQATSSQLPIPAAEHMPHLITGCRLCTTACGRSS